MLSKKYRLTKKADFKSIYKRSPKQRGEFVSIRFLKNNLDVSRFAFVISNQTISKASKRNFLKRRLREAVAKNLNRIKPGFDVILKLDRIPKGAESKKLSQDVESLLVKFELFND